MIVVATMPALLEETAARALADAIAEDGALAGHAVDFSEKRRGRWQVAVYFERRPGRAERAALARLGGQAKFIFATLPKTDWVAKSLAGLAPVRAARFLIHGAHDRAQRRENDIAIEIEAGLAFGTGHHGTTAGCLIAIDRLARARRFVNALDLGTGSGVLAVALAKRMHAMVTASDIDPVAVTVARENARLNGIGGAVRIVTAAGFNHPLVRGGAPYDLIAANILAGPLVALAPALRRALVPGGVAILSGILVDQRRRIVAAYRGQGLILREAITLGEWVTLVLAG